MTVKCTQDREDIDFEAGNLSHGLGTQPRLQPRPRLDRSLQTPLRRTSRSSLKKRSTSVNNEDCDDPFDGYVFTVDGFETTFGLIGAEPLTFVFGEDPGVEFTPYVFESLGTGFGAFVGTPDFLSFLQPTLTIAYGRYEEEGSDKPENDDFELPIDGTYDVVVVEDDPLTEEDETETVTVRRPFEDAYYRAIRGTLTPFEGETFSATGGFSYAQLSGNAP